MELLDGKKVKMYLFKELKKKLNKINRRLGFYVIQIGNNDSDNIYLKSLEKMANELNYNIDIVKYSNDTCEDTILSLIKKLNKDNYVDGIILLGSISDCFNLYKIQNSISHFKDIDGITDINMGKLVHGSNCLISATALGIIDLLKYYNIDVSGKNVAIVGRSDLVGKPLASLLINNDATVTICHSKTNNLKKITREADIVIAVAGVPGLIDKDFLKEGAIVIDAGINKTVDGIVGDVLFDDVADKVGYITPVPGGVGQVTIAEIGFNIYKAYIDSIMGDFYDR